MDSNEPKRPLSEKSSQPNTGGALAGWQLLIRAGRILLISVFFVVYFGMILLVQNRFWSLLAAIAIIFLCYFFVETLCRQYLHKGLPIGIKIGIIAVPCLVLVLLWGLDIVGSRKLAGQVAAARAKMYPLTGRELTDHYQPVDPSRNGGYLVLASAKTLDYILRQQEDASGWPLRDTESFLQKSGNPQELEKWQNLLDVCAKPTQIMDQALTFPELQNRFEFPNGFDVFSFELPHLSTLKGSADLFALEALYHQKNREVSKACKSIRRIFSMAEVLKQEPLLISQLVRNAIHHIGVEALGRFVAQCPDPELLEELKATIAPLGVSKNLRVGLAGELVMAYAVIDDRTLLMNSPWSAFAHQAMLKNIDITPWQFVSTGWVKLDIAAYMEKFMDILELLGQDEAVIRAKLKSWRNPTPTIAYPIATMITPDWKEMILREFQHLSWLRCAWTALAVKKYQLQTGKLPDSLNFIGKEYARWLADPCSDKTLQYKKSEPGYIVYSVGANWVDDGGELKDQNIIERAKDFGILVER